MPQEAQRRRGGFHGVVGAVSRVKLGSWMGGGGTCAAGAGCCRMMGGAGFLGPYFFHKIHPTTNKAVIRTYFLYLVKKLSKDPIKPFDVAAGTPAAGAVCGAVSGAVSGAMCVVAIFFF